MGVSQPTAAKIVQRLKTLSLVENRPYRALSLTEDGRSLAARSRERHQAVADCCQLWGLMQTPWRSTRKEWSITSAIRL
ncbi:hypothetical protein KZ820_19255 [Sphingomonas sp. RRHST34]|uniref:HTH marR-type domain-containing protein n=1 Tax=Sphingomonas citri TaxID=2862499 RepID=A0ABS7BTF7_9SPHN|nr:hypothetical protein [Sphingomonas citri]